MSVSRKRIEIPAFVEPIAEREAERAAERRRPWRLKNSRRFVVVLTAVVAVLAAVTVVVLPAHKVPAPPTTVQTVPRAVSEPTTASAPVAPPAPVDPGPVRAPLALGAAGVCGILPTPACNGKEEYFPGNNNVSGASGTAFLVSKGQEVKAPMSGDLIVFETNGDHWVVIQTPNARVVVQGHNDSVMIEGVIAEWPAGTVNAVTEGEVIGTVASETPIRPDVGGANLIVGFWTAPMSRGGAWLSSMQKEILAH
ncbi:MAG TPA: hypothetical protein VMU70_01325 [Candidatus Tyrphobacter sp.]|nr:hypothetical protein [Candidatus Tyrphobacter sp.]